MRRNCQARTVLVYPCICPYLTTNASCLTDSDITTEKLPPNQHDGSSFNFGKECRNGHYARFHGIVNAFCIMQIALLILHFAFLILHLKLAVVFDGVLVRLNHLRG